MYKKYFKRTLDILISLFLLIPTLFVTIIVGLLIKIEDGGPVFYNGERLGKDGKVFKMHKFRSMKVNAPDIRNDDGSTFNSKNDPRLTKIGKFLRETSIDELPQIFNVLKGNMSIIGPRASLNGALVNYKIDEFDKMKVRPGITGYNQAYYRNSASTREKRINDVWYANNVSFFLDIKIFFKTLITVFNRDNLYTSSQNRQEKDDRKAN